MRKIRWQSGILSLCLLQSITLWAQWGEVKKEQIEDAFLRNDVPDVMQSDTASLTINAVNPSPPTQALFTLQSGGSDVFSANANGDVSISGGLVVDDDLEASGYAKFGTPAETSSGAAGLHAGWHMNEGSGILDNFEGTADYDLTAYNTPTYDVAAVFDTGLTFNGSDEYAEIVGEGALELTGWPVTMSAWFRTSTVAAQTVFSIANPGVGNIIYSLEVRSTGHVMGFRRNTSATYTFGQSYVCDGEWHHAVFVIAGNADSKIYVDGVLEGINTISVTWNGSVDAVSIGRSGDDSPSGYFNGTIDEVVIYDTALSATDIRELYANGNKTTIKNGLVCAMIVDASNVAAISIIAQDDIVQKYDSDYTRAVPVMEDSVEHPHPIIYYGTCSDGSITYTSDGFRTAFASGCTPVITITPEGLATSGYEGPQLHWLKVNSNANTGFTYKLYMWEWDPSMGEWDNYNADVTSSYTVHWQAMGWVD